MILEIPDEERRIINPTREDTIAAVRNLSWDSEKDGCVDIMRDPLTYLQLIVTPTNDFHLEYQENNIENHWYASNLVDLDAALRIACNYMDDTPTWRDGVVWIPKKVKVRRAARSFGSLLKSLFCLSP
jgi:hypothetical protein